MTTNHAHSPLPWTLLLDEVEWLIIRPGDGSYLERAVATLGACREEEANGRFIARACNAHEELLACCRWLVDYAPTPADAARVRAAITKAAGERTSG